MDFDLTDEQLMLRQTAERFGAEHYGDPKSLRMHSDDASKRRANWLTMAQNGWLLLPLSESQGGLGGTAVDVMVLMEAFGNHLIREPYATSCVLAPAILGGGADGTVSGVLEGIARGTLLAAAALAESAMGFELNRVATVAVADGGTFRIDGEKCFVENGADADWFIIAARTRGGADERQGISLFLVARDALGLSIEGYRSIDHHRHARLRLEQVRVDAAALLGPLDGGLPLLEAAVDRTIACYLAEAVGCMDALRERTLAYLKSRQQFGVPIGSFQALQHRMVDIAIACEEARSMMYYATLHLEADVLDRRRAIAAAKARIGQLGLYVGRQCVQLHGGIGAADENIVSHYLRRLMMIDLAFGNSDHHRTVFANCS